MQWKTRIALREGNWPVVKATIQAMPASLRADPTWVYWLARAQQAETPGRPNAQARCPVPHDRRPVEFLRPAGQ